MTNRQGYLGNSRLKAAGETIEITAENQREFVRCMNDPIYFAENYIKIVHVDKGVIPFKMYDYQKEMFNLTFKHRRVAVLTARQAGKSTSAMAIILHYIIFNKHKEVAILANKGAAAVEVLSRIKLAYENLPKWMQHGIVKWNSGSIELDNGCKVFAGTTSSSSIRGRSISFLYVDESAFVEGWDEFFQSVYPTISSGESTKLFMTSTPNGLNHFYKICTLAQRPHDDPEWNGYHFLKVSWDQVPGRGEEWFQETMQALNFDTQKFAQEYEGEFLGSSGTLINGASLKALVSKVPIKENENTQLFEDPKPGRIYTITADCSSGKGLDYAAAHVIDITEMPFRQVCTFRDNMVTPIEYAEILFRMIKTFNNAFCLIELNNMGAEVANLLLYDFECESLLFTESAGRNGKKISGGYGKNVDPGIFTSTAVKATGCSTLKLLIEQQQLIINDFNTIEELSKFSKKGKSYEAESGANDDLVMGLVLFAWMSNQSFFKELNNINTLEHLREKNRLELEESMVIVGMHTSDLDNSMMGHNGGPHWAESW